MSLPSITETKNATLLRIELWLQLRATLQHLHIFAILDLRLVAATLSWQQGQRHSTFVECHGTRILQVKIYILIMDPEHTVLMTSSRYCYFNYAGNYNTDSNFYIMECLGLMAAIPRWMLGQRHTWWSRVPKAPSTYQVPILTYWPDLLKMTIKLEPTDAAVHYFTGWTDTYPTLKLLRAPSGLYWKNGLKVV